MPVVLQPTTLLANGGFVAAVAGPKLVVETGVIVATFVEIGGLIPEQLTVDSGNRGEAGVINTGEGGRNEGISPKDFMVVDENVQSLQGGNLNITLWL